MSEKWVNPARKEIREVIAQKEALPRIIVTVTKERIRVGWLIVVGLSIAIFVLTCVSFRLLITDSFPWNTTTTRPHSGAALVHWVLIPLELLAIVASVFAFGLSELLMLLHWALRRKK